MVFLVPATLAYEKAVTYSEPTKEELIEYVFELADYFDVSASQMVRTISCESGFQSIQSNIYHNGVREQSFGIAQIHLPSHPDIAYEQAMNPYFSIRFMARSFASEDQWMWTCWRNIYTSNSPSH